MSRRHRIRFLEQGGRYVCNARFCKFTTASGLSREAQMTLALRHVAAENRVVTPAEESPVAPVAG